MFHTSPTAFKANYTLPFYKRNKVSPNNTNREEKKDREDQKTNKTLAIPPHSLLTL